MKNQKISLIVQPGDSFFPIVEAIDSARETVNITIFRMDDPVVQQALLDAGKRGVKVRALVAANPRGWQKQNRKLLKELKGSGIQTKQPAGETSKARYHYKIITVDRTKALILTFNPTRENLHYTRDYGVVLRDPKIAAELDRLFDADWNEGEFQPDADSPLVISPYNSREKIASLLNGATKSIHISDAKLRDYQILNVLLAKAQAGVDVRILGKDRYYTEVFAHLNMRQITRFKLHAKCVVVDGQRALIGSMNLRYEGFEKRREVGILLDNPSVVEKLEEIFESDWKQKPGGAGPSITRTLDTVISALPIVPPSTPADRFILLSRRDALSRYPLHDGVNRLGRAEDNDVVVLDPQVSRYHAEVAIAPKGITFSDLNSQNGSFVNGEPVKGSVPIKPGDVIAIADSDEFRLVEV